MRPKSLLCIAAGVVVAWSTLEAGKRIANRNSRQPKGRSRTPSGGNKGSTSSSYGGTRSHSRGLTRDQLYAEAKRRGVRGRSKMNKAQLEQALGSSRARSFRLNLRPQPVARVRT